MTTKTMPPKMYVIVTVNPDASPLVLAVCTEDKLDRHVQHCMMGLTEQYEQISKALGKKAVPPPLMVSEVEFSEASEKHVFTGNNQVFVPKDEIYNGLPGTKPGKPNLAN